MGTIYYIINCPFKNKINNFLFLGLIKKKISAVGISKLLTETPDFFVGNNFGKFVPLLQALVALFELPEDSSTADEEHFVDIMDDPNYQNAYSKLIFAGKAGTDPAKLAGVNLQIFILFQLFESYT